MNFWNYNNNIFLFHSFKFLFIWIILIFIASHTLLLYSGTLLNSKHQLTPRTIETLQKLSNSGVTVCIATGRSIASVVGYLQQLQLSQQKIPIVCFNGSVGKCWFLYTLVLFKQNMIYAIWFLINISIFLYELKVFNMIVWLGR